MRIKKRGKACSKRYEDKILWAGLCAFAVIILLMAVFVPVEEAALPAASECWNTREMIAGEGIAAQEAESLYQIQRVYDNDDGFPKGLKIKWAKAQGTRVLVVFERYRDLNPVYDRDYLAVYDVSGQFLYGFEGILPYMSTEIALMESREGILFWEWKMKQTEDALFLVVNPDGSKQMYVTTDELWPDTPAYWESEYRVVQTKESKLVIAHAGTGEQNVVFDYSDAYPAMYPNSSKIDEDFEQLFNVLFPFVFIIVMAVFVLPRMADNPDIPKRGIKEPYGDLRDRWR